MGLPVIRFHDLRHSFATWGLTCGVPVKVISEALGHASVAFTMRVYAHVIPGMHDEGVARMSAALAALQLPDEQQAT